ncbi:MAG: hypothetical protein ACI9L6_001447 [Flavobacterium sp.]|jgi:hypothetical protein
MFKSSMFFLSNSCKRVICFSIIFLVIGASAQTLPTINSFSPLTGDAGTTITITGTNFSTTAANNVVFFGATKATVSAATATSLTVTVAAGATYGPLTLVDLSINRSISSKKFFTPTFSPTKGVLTAADYSTEQEFSTGQTEPSQIAATGDLDGDGKPDIIIADGSATNTMLILRNVGGNGTASFETALSINTGGYNTSLAVGDIDADGKLDIVEVNYNNSSYVKVYLNTTIAVGSISFADPINLITEVSDYRLRNVAISDLDGDGKADIAVVDSAGSVLLYRNTGSVGVVRFDTKVEFSTGIGQGIMIGDIDSDGLPDLAITSKGTSIRVLRNTSTNGTLNFVNSGDFTIGGTEPTDLALGDLDGDGKLDIATVNFYGANVSVLLNTSTSGTVSFANNIDFAIGRYAKKIAIGDLTGDGKLDVVITQSGAVMSIFTNTTTTAGTVTFAPMIDIAGTGNSLQAIIGDLDGDGKTDFATGGSKKIIVFSNGDPLENADLEALSISGDGTLSPTFTPSTTAYTSIVSNTITSIIVTPTQTTSNATATIQVRVNAGSYVAVASASASDPLDLIVGANTIDVKVTSPDGTTIKNYPITVTRDMPVPSYIISGAGTAAVNGLYVYFGKNNSNKRVWKFGSYYLTSNSYEAWIGSDPNYSWSGVQYKASSSATNPTKWIMRTDWGTNGAAPNPIIELAASKVSYASSIFMEHSANDGAVSATTTIAHNNYENATFAGTDGENFIASGKAIATGVPAGLTAVITRDNSLQLTFSLTGNASAHANANDLNNLTITFQDAAFSDNDAANTTNYATNLSINFIEQINVGSGQTYTTIQSAVNAAGNGDVLLLVAQTFTEQNITISNKSLTIIGVSPAATIIQANAVAGSATDRVFNIANDSYAVTNFHSFEKLTIRHGNVANSNGSDRGGALFASNTTLKLKDCTIESNRVGTTGWGGYGVGGAGIFVQLSNFISENCTYYDNHHTSASRPGDMMGGGAVAFFTDDTKPNYMKVTNSTFSGNTSGNFGGAIFTRRRPAALNDIRITNSTFVGNSAPYGGGYSSMGSSVSPQPTYLTNSLFYENTASLGGSQMYSNETTNWKVNNCLIESTSAGQLAGVYADCIIGVDPLLGTLANNGGYTKTYSIGSGSPAIDKGSTTVLSLDQRGFTVQGTNDIGAYEYGGTVPSTNSNNADLSDLSISAGALDPIFASGTTSYTASVSNASITVTPASSDENATIQVQVNSGGYTTVSTATASAALELNRGSNTVDVKVTAEDATTKNYTITVTRTSPPTAVCQNRTVLLNAAGNVTIVAADVDNGSSDIEGPVRLSISRNTFSCEDLGTVVDVTLTVTDTEGLKDTCVATVTILDKIAPTVLTKNITTELDVNGEAVIVGEDVNNGSTDNCGIPTFTLSRETFDCSNIGENTVILTVTDASGNSATATAVVTVIDPNAANVTFTAPADLCSSAGVQRSLSGGLPSGGVYSGTGVTDDRNGTSYSFDPAIAGAHSISYTFTNASGCVATAADEIAVLETMAPLIDVITVTVSGSCSNYGGFYNFTSMLNDKKSYSTADTGNVISYNGSKWVLQQAGGSRYVLFENSTVAAGVTPPLTGWVATRYCRSSTMEVGLGVNFTGTARAEDLETLTTGTNLQFYDVATAGTALRSAASLAAGVYYVSDTDTANGCESKRTSFNVKIEGGGGRTRTRTRSTKFASLADKTAIDIEGLESKVLFSMYPNPSAENVTLSSSMDGDFWIFNLVGQVVKTFTLKANLEKVVYVGDLSAGTYVVKPTNSSSISSQKLIIRK